MTRLPVHGRYCAQYSIASVSLENINCCGVFPGVRPSAPLPKSPSLHSTLQLLCNIFTRPIPAGSLSLLPSIPLPPSTHISHPPLSICTDAPHAASACTLITLWTLNARLLRANRPPLGHCALTNCAKQRLLAPHNSQLKTLRRICTIITLPDCAPSSRT